MIDLLDYKDRLKVVSQDDRQKIYDVVRRRYFILTPEELVRQLFVSFLIDKISISAKRIAVERQIKVFGKNHRFDILVFSSEAHPMMIVECKSHYQKLNNNVAIQAAKYNFELKAPYLCVTNGMETKVFNIDFENENIVPLEDFPRL
ncbi:MAG: type I restriction enzyme HsdR N-terminal domain-containing protein [Saprospiraceae bacterium]